MAGAGDEFSKSVPINDNEWHHIVTTYGGAHKKIYVDGVEVATAAQTGGVTASTFKLTLGDPNLYGGSATRPRIDDVRYYSVCSRPPKSPRFITREKTMSGPKNLA